VADQPLGTLVRQIHRLAGPPPGDEERDHALVQRLIDHGDEAAFTALLRRHGPMVRDVCRRVLDQDADVDDAFQATFLVLFRQARSIRKRASVASWLYGVAYRTALRARDAGRPPPRRGRPVERGEVDPGREAAWRELCRLVDEELQGLSETYRGPLVLCYFQGQTRDQAAIHLGLSLRTLERRLERGRELLRVRLGRRGVTLSAALLAPGLSQQTVAARLPAALATTTVRMMRAVLAGGAAEHSAVPPGVIALVNGAVTANRGGGIKILTVLVLAVGAAGMGWLAQPEPAAEHPGSPPRSRGPSAPPRTAARRRGQPFIPTGMATPCRRGRSRGSAPRVSGIRDMCIGSRSCPAAIPFCPPASTPCARGI
jgi:RNA polymerase sigma factor (sigma-70 family)